MASLAFRGGGGGGVEWGGTGGAHAVAETQDGCTRQESWRQPNYKAAGGQKGGKKKQ